MSLGDDANAALVNAFRAVVVLCDASTEPTKASAAVVAHFALGSLALVTTHPAARNHEHAARHFRSALAAAQRVGTLPEEEARELVKAAALNLAPLEAETPEERERRNSEQLTRVREDAGGHLRFLAHVSTTERPACSACGKQPLTLKRCTGTCGGAVRYCDATCFASHIRQHMRESGCKKRK